LSVVTYTATYKEKTMRKFLAPLFIFFISSQIYTQDEEIETIMLDETTLVSCFIKLKLNAIQAQSSDPAGKAIVLAMLYDENNNPISGHKINFSASWGTFFCSFSSDSSSASSSDDRTCFFTNNDGKCKLYLSNIPFNKPITINASCNCGERQIQATGTISITRQVIKKGN
jgi:hypothetical protein